MRILTLIPKMSLILILGILICNFYQTNAQNNSRDWFLGIHIGIEKAKSDLEGCDSCFRASYVVSPDSTVSVYPIAKGFYGINFAVSARKKFNKYFSFLTGLQYIPSRKIGFSNIPVFVGNNFSVGTETYQWKHEIEIPTLLSFHLPLFKKKLEIVSSGGINFGFGRQYYVESVSNIGRSTLRSNYNSNGLSLLRMSPVFDFRIDYSLNKNTLLSVRYFTQAMLPFIVGEIEEPVFTNGVRIGYHKSASSLFKAKLKK